MLNHTLVICIYTWDLELEITSIKHIGIWKQGGLEYLSCVSGFGQKPKPNKSA